MYMPTLARFTARDPLSPDGEPVLLAGLSDDLARSAPSGPYTYAANNPAKYVDPSGLSPIGGCPFVPTIFPPIIPCVSIPVGQCRIKNIERPPKAATDKQLKRFGCPRVGGWTYVPLNDKDGDLLFVACVRCQSFPPDPCREVGLCPSAPLLGVGCYPRVNEVASIVEGRLVADCVCRHANWGDPGVV
jgi:RHS repeat-associated protein